MPIIQFRSAVDWMWRVIDLVTDQFMRCTFYSLLIEPFTIYSLLFELVIDVIKSISIYFIPRILLLGLLVCMWYVFIKRNSWSNGLDPIEPIDWLKNVDITVFLFARHYFPDERTNGWKIIKIHYPRSLSQSYCFVPDSRALNSMSDFRLIFKSDRRLSRNRIVP